MRLEAAAIARLWPLPVIDWSRRARIWLSSSRRRCSSSKRALSSVSRTSPNMLSALRPSAFEEITSTPLVCCSSATPPRMVV